MDDFLLWTVTSPTLLFFFSKYLITIEDYFDIFAYKIHVLFVVFFLFLDHPHCAQKIGLMHRFINIFSVKYISKVFH